MSGDGSSLTLGDRQRLFVRLQAQLVSWALSHGYELTDGEARRSNEQAEINAMGPAGRERLAKLVERDLPAFAAAVRDNVGSGIRGSLHEVSLARDYNLFKDGAYLPDTASHRPLGEYWKSLHPLCRWGGDFGDGNHYSITYGGRQ